MAVAINGLGRGFRWDMNWQLYSGHFNSLIDMYTGETNMLGKPIYIVWGYP